MPTIEEKFEGLIEFYQQALEQPCLCCNGSGKKVTLGLRTVECWRCEGTGKEEEGTSLERVCGVCLGARKVDEPELKESVSDCDCDGGVLRVHRHADCVSSPLLALCMMAMKEARDGGDFATADQILEYAVRYIQDKVVSELEFANEHPEAKEQMVQMFQKMTDFKPAERLSLVGGALSQEELDELLAEESKARGEIKP
jgi:hypothetical protein